MNCNQCEYLFINGIGCHETGCPNAYKTETKCEWCGQVFVPESRFQKCCEHSCAVAYSNIDCGCEECQEQDTQEVAQ